MKSTKIVAVGVGACAAACAGAAALPLLAGAGILGAGGLGAGTLLAGLGVAEIICVGAPILIFIAAGIFFVTRQRTSHPASCAADGSCGCGEKKLGV
jgi:hypothetical protein